MSPGRTDAARIVGCYELVALRQDGADGVPVEQAPPSVGRLSYDESGRVSVLIHRRDRPIPAHLTEVGLAEYQAMGEGTVAYYGSYEIDEAAATVVHHVEAAFHPLLIGRDLVRRYELSADQLILRFRESSLLWRRLPSP